MRIVVNALFLIPGRVGGSETYLRGLVQGLGDTDSNNEYIVCLGPEAAPTIEAPNRRWRVLASPTPSRWRAARLSLEQLWLPALGARLRADLIHSTGYTGPVGSMAARVTTIHDMNYKRHPEDLSIAERLVYGAIIPPVARNSSRVLTDSEAARRDIVRWTGAGASRVAVVHLGRRTDWPGHPDDDHDRLRAAGVSGPFLLSVAASYPHKNLPRLIEAFVTSAESQSRAVAQLVIVGLRGRALPHITIAAAKRPDSVKVLGWVGDALLASLYRRCLALVFPSLYEGFGLPIVEAMSLGAAVLTSNIGAMAEVAGGAAELVDPYDVESIRRGLVRLLDDEDRRAELRELGNQRALLFSWERTARQTLAVYETAALGTRGKSRI